MNLSQQVRQLLIEMGSGQMITRSAYDTAWLARLTELDRPLSEQALAWLRANQLPDGSWGSPEPLYYSDRIVCTLSAMVALASLGHSQDLGRLQRGKASLESYLGQLKTGSLNEMIGIEMILPALLAEAESLNILKIPHDNPLWQLTLQRETKLAALPKGIITRDISVAFSSEMVGREGIHLLDVEKLPEMNGSIAYSPAATTFFTLYVRHNDQAGLKFLHTYAIDGAVPYIAPIDIFEQGWILWNLSLSDFLDDELQSLCQPHLDLLEAEWKPDKGIAACSGLSLPEADTTSVVFETLSRFGRSVDLEGVLSYEEADHFRCFALESNPSISTNIHVLGALRQAGLCVQHPTVVKVRQFLYQQQIEQSYWIDKWHTSPYYTTSQAIIVSAGYDDILVEKAVDWILATQYSSGAWGFYLPTAEETAYSLQALAIWKRSGHPVPDKALQAGRDWLIDHAELPSPPLWIGKCLYSPTLVVQSAIISALIMVTEM